MEEKAKIHTLYTTDLPDIDHWLENEIGAKKGTSEHTTAKIAIEKLLNEAALYIKAERVDEALENSNNNPMSAFRNAVNWTFGAVIEPLTGVEPCEFDEF